MITQYRKARDEKGNKILEDISTGLKYRVVKKRKYKSIPFRDVKGKIGKWSVCADSSMDRFVLTPDSDLNARLRQECDQRWDAAKEHLRAIK